MKSLESIATNVAKEVLKSKGSKKRNVNTCLFELLFNQKQKLTRQQCLMEAAKMRFTDVHGEDLNKVFKDDAEVAAAFKKELLTTSNGIDQSFANGQNNASFNNSKYFEGYSLQETKPGSGTYEIVKLK